MKYELGMEKGKFFYDKDTAPELRIESGDVVTFVSDDANCGLIKSERDKWDFASILKAAGGCNPVAGPVYVNGAKRGDVLCVTILDIEPGFRTQKGYTSVQSGVGCLENVQGTLQDPLAPATRICDITPGGVRMKNAAGDGYYTVPLRPFVGSVGVAPRYDRRASLYQGSEWMGNVDIPQLGVGATAVLPVNVDGGLLWLGDVHACQGDGEITGCALECQGRTTARVEVMSAQAAGYAGCPQINAEGYIGSVGLPFCSDYTAAVRVGYTDLVRRLTRFYGFTAQDAYMLLGLAGRVTAGNEFCCLCSIDRSAIECHKN